MVNADFAMKPDEATEASQQGFSRRHICRECHRVAPAGMRRGRKT
jgi:hypothetical protein